jgi:hypothetical protein
LTEFRFRLIEPGSRTRRSGLFLDVADFFVIMWTLWSWSELICILRWSSFTLYINEHPTARELLKLGLHIVK